MIAAFLTLFLSLDVTACTAVTRADIEIALASKVSRGQEENANGSSTCDYTGRRGQVTVTMQRLAALPDLAQEQASLKAEFPNSTIRPIRFEGADAFFLDLGPDGTLLHVIRGHDFVLIAILGFGAPEHVSPAAATLARTALSRL